MEEKNTEVNEESFDNKEVNEEELVKEEKQEEVSQQVEQPQETAKPKRKLFQLPKLFKNKVLVFVLISVLTLIGGVILFLIDDSNAFRRKLGIKDADVAWLRKIFNFDVSIITWLLFAIIMGAIFFTVFTIFFRKSIKEGVENKRKKKTGQGFSEKGSKIYDVVYWIIFAVIVLAIGAGIGLMFASEGGGFAQRFNAYGAGGFGAALLSFLGTFGLLLLGVAIIPLGVLALYILYRLTILLFGGVAGGIAKSVMASSNFQETYAAAQAASSKIRSEMGSASLSGGSEGSGSGQTSKLGQSSYGGILFPALDAIDQKYAALEAQEAPELIEVEVEEIKQPEEKKPVGNKKQDLSTLVDEFQQFLVQDEKLYYSKNVLRTFIAGMAASRLLLLEGLSGTGKSCLPRKFRDFTEGKATFLQVQATWRDRTDIIGYFSDLTGYYKETELLKSIYDSLYNPDEINLIVLDEMNISRAEYYFADFLSIYEYPSSDWKVQLMQVSKGMQLPKKIDGGAIQIPTNVWFVGTINVDDSTFTVTDKVYDRAIVINFNAINEPFEVDYKRKLEPFGYEALNEFFESCQSNPRLGLTKDDRHNLFELLSFLDETFEIKVGNRIFNQIDNFVPVFVGLGGDKFDAIDMMVSAKIFRKLDLVFMMDMADSLIKLQRFLNAHFGKGKLPKCEAKINSLLRKYQ